MANARFVEGDFPSLYEDGRVAEARLDAQSVFHVGRDGPHDAVAVCGGAAPLVSPLIRPTKQVDLVRAARPTARRNPQHVLRVRRDADDEVAGSAATVPFPARLAAWTAVADAETAELEDLT